MNFCLATKSMPVHGAGGMETHAASFAEELVRQGHRVTVLTTRHPDGTAVHEDAGAEVHYLDSPSARYSPSWWSESARRFCSLHEMKRFQAVFCESIAAAAITSLADRPPVFPIVYGLFRSQVQSQWEDVRGLRAAIRWALVQTPENLYYALTYERRLLQRAATVIATNDWLVSLYAEKTRRVVVAYNGVDAAYFKPRPDLRAETRSRLGLPANAFVVAMVGTINYQKGVDFGLRLLFSLMDQHPELHALIAGSGPLEASLRSWSSEQSHRERVRFVGGIAHSDLLGIYNASDLFLFPSTRREGLPTVVLEAMACGVPAVTTDRGTSSAIEHGVNGYLVPAERRSLLRAGLQEAILSPPLLREWSRKARETAVRKFHFPDVVRRLLAELFPGAPA